MMQLNMTLTGQSIAGGGKSDRSIEVSRSLNLGATLNTPEDLEKLKSTWSNLVFNQIESLNCALFAAFKAEAQKEPPALLPPAPAVPTAPATPAAPAVPTVPVAEKPNGKPTNVPAVRAGQTPK